MQILNHQQMQQQMANEKMQRPPNMVNPSNQPHPAMMGQGMIDASGPQPQVQVPTNAPGISAVRKKIWTGILEWNKKEKNTPADKVPQQIPCYVTAKEGEQEMCVFVTRNVFFSEMFQSMLMTDSLYFFFLKMFIDKVEVGLNVY